MKNMFSLFILIFLLSCEKVSDQDKPIAGKKISCALENNPNPLRYDEFIFSTDDFKKDFPKAVHIVTFASNSSTGSKQSIDYTVTPTHIIFKAYDSYWGNMYHTINRKNLQRDTDWLGISKCSISDISDDENVF